MEQVYNLENAAGPRFPVGQVGVGGPRVPFISLLAGKGLATVVHAMVKSTKYGKRLSGNYSWYKLWPEC